MSVRHLRHFIFQKVLTTPPYPHSLDAGSLNFIIFDFFFLDFFSGFLKFRRGVLRDELLVIFGIEHDHNSSIPEGVGLTRLILVRSLKSVKTVQNPEIIL